ncbi:LysR family transcriptional regulator [Bordetella genomosp. 13]|uniref:LysR family transcriptional regulator n=1 Tax=Bordetella genomosp. 13 TaxID=463040 RepID=UPI00119F985D|nr:LysR family transcriptional regulator [Bordetella genomosp. 13]
MRQSASGFNFNDIVYFVEVAKRQSLSRTAESIDVPASTLSRRLQALEQHLGVQLLARSTRKIVLTEAGKLYYDRCRQLVEQASDAQDVLLQQGIKPSGTLKVLLPDPLDALRFASLLQDFAQDWPTLDFHCDYTGGRGWEASREFDVAVRWGVQPDSDLVARCLGFVPFRLYASRAYLGRHGWPETPADLHAHECLRCDVCPELSAWTLVQGDERIGVSPRARLRANDLEIVRRFAVSGTGIAALPAAGPQDTRLVPILPHWRLDPVGVYALFGSRTPPARARVFVDFLVERLATLSARLPLAGAFDDALPALPDRNDPYASRKGQPWVPKVDAWTLSA